jgi:hypothetical protein
MNKNVCVLILLVVCFSFVCFVFLNKCPSILDSGLKYELICGFCFIAGDENTFRRGPQVRVAIWSLFAHKWRPHLQEEFRGRHIHGRHGDHMLQMATFTYQVWSPFGRHGDLTCANGDHMQT